MKCMTTNGVTLHVCAEISKNWALATYFISYSAMQFLSNFFLESQNQRLNEKVPQSGSGDPLKFSIYPTF